MKKILLLVSTFSALCANLNAQNSNIKVGIKNMSMIDNEKNTLEKPITIPNSKAASTINVGTSDNVFSILGDRQNQVVYNANINTIAFVHRQNAGGAGGSGIISIDYSTDGGVNWIINPYTVTPNGSGSAWNGNRYPNIGIYNPIGNTNSSNAYLIEVGPALETGTGSNDNGWAKTFRSSHKLDGTNLDETYDYNSLSTLNDPNEWGAGGLYVNNNGTVWYVSTNNNNSGASPNPAYDVADNYSKYFLVKGEFNSTNNNFDWTVVDTISPNWNITDYNGSDYNMGGLMNMAWSPDGNTGYFVAMGSWGTNTMWRPYVLKTTDAGATWNQYNDFDFSTVPLLQCQVFPAQGVGTPRPWFSSYDVVVGNDNELRIFVEIQSQSSAHPDSLLFAYTAPQSTALYEVATNGTSWDVTFVDSIYVTDYEWDGTNQLSHFVRPQAGRSQDGSKVFYTWLASDPAFSADRQFPVIHSRGHELSSGMWTPVTNITAGTDAEFVAGYPTLAVDAIENGTEKQWELPIVYGVDISGNSLVNGLNPTQWVFLRGVGFDQSEFTSTPIADPCNIVGINESKVAQTDVSIYPNPSVGRIFVRVPDGSFEYTITNMLGNVVQTGISQSSIADIELTSLSKGTFFITINNNNNLFTKKLIINQ